jgi:hypothetical protein
VLQYVDYRNVPENIPLPISSATIFMIFFNYIKMCDISAQTNEIILWVVTH